MIGRRAVVGLSLLSALLFCAFAAQSASAAVSTNTTMYTCITAPGNGDFEDAHCDKRHPEKKGNFTHELIPLNTTTEVAAEQTTNAVLKSKVGLTATEITCTVTKNNAAESLSHNVDNAGKHELTGVVVTEFKTCTVNKPAKCTVKEPIVSRAKVVGVEKLGAGANEMGAELKGSGEEETFAEITFEGAECSLKGKTFKVKGSVIGTSPIGNTIEPKHTGGTAVFSPEKEMEKLKLGVEVAEFTVTVTQKMAGGGAITATTVT